MVFGLFKKKKKVVEDGTEGTAKPEKPTKTSKKKEKTPQNLKESSTTDDTKQPVEPPKIQDDNEDQWKFDSIVQFLQSPIWRIPLVDFVDEHCSIFDNTKKDKPEYKETHEAYKKMVEGLVEDMLCELEIEIEKFTEIVHAGVNDKIYKKTFEQFLTVDNYTVFKKIMFKRNKELELEAMQQLHELEKQKAKEKRSKEKESKESKEEAERVERENEQDLLKLMKEKEEAEIEHAMALSLAVEEERQKLIEQEDDELQEAMRQSEIEYSKFQKDVKEQQDQIEHEKKAKQEELERYEREKHEREELLQKQKERDELLQKQKEKELEKEKEIAKVHAEEVARKKSQEIEAAKSLTEIVEEEKIEHRPEETKSQQDLNVSHKKLQPLQNAPKASLPELTEKRSIFPPIKGSAGYDPMADYTPEVEKKPVKHEIKDETLDERKRRLQAQRDLILAKKKKERDTELKDYEAKRGTTQKINIQKSGVEDISGQEMVRRKEIYGKLKGEL